jgi:hypothetical protein
MQPGKGYTYTGIIHTGTRCAMDVSISKSDVKGLEKGSITNHINQSYQQAQASSSPAPTEIKNFKIKESLVLRCFEENS